MTPRYVILAGGSAEDRQRLAARSELPARVTLATALILADVALTDQSPGAPVIIGHAFPTDIAAMVAARTPKALLGCCWGRYVAVFDEGERGVRVLRDPSAALSCYYTRLDHLTVISSDTALLDVVTRARTVLDWEEIGRILVEVDLRGAKTALQDIVELLPGHSLTVDAGRTTLSHLWSPWDHARWSDDATFEDHARAVRKSVDNVIERLLSGPDRAVATVSGGLDSSIVALSAARHVELNCMTLVTSDPSGDERRYARLVSEAATSRYSEEPLDTGVVSLVGTQAAHLPRPIGRPFLVAMLDGFARVLKRDNATVLLNGLGGDNVFCFLQSATPAADRARTGDLLGAAATIRDIADMTGASYPQVVGATLRRIARGSRPQPWPRDPRYVTRGLIEDTPGFVHPWLQAPRNGRWGTRAHIAMLLRIQNYLDPWIPAATFDVMNPLLAQPVMETCLAVQSWHWCQGGQDRAVARAAFDDVMPAPILSRRWKGGPEGFVSMIADRQRATMRAMLIDGLLADHNMIDRQQVATALDDARPLAASDAIRLLMLTDAEAWVRGRP